MTELLSRLPPELVSHLREVVFDVLVVLSVVVFLWRRRRRHKIGS